MHVSEPVLEFGLAQHGSCLPVNMGADMQLGACAPQFC